MATCKRCDRDMLDDKVETCLGNIFIEYPDGLKLISSNFHFGESTGKCHDCGIKHGGKHHLNCDVERCPRCEGQLITCGCLS